MKAYRYGLSGTRSVFEASDHVNRQAFGQIIKLRDMAEEFPAATGMGYIHRVPKDQLSGLS